MNKKNLLVATFLGLALSFSAQAATQKIATVDPREILSKLPQTEAVSQKLKSEFTERQEKLKLLSKEINDLQEKGKRDAPTMSSTEVTQLSRDIEAKVNAFKLDEKSFKEDFQRRQKEELYKLQTQIFNAIDAVSKKSSYDLVLAKEVVLYGSESSDISDEVLKFMLDNKKP
ncbi:MAG: molecular chaperone [Gammaproteobacteria bacterium CG22_combo_CG10-13_8_21_14_all_40_8]|nr:MAG: molecular chaperone [Gammaproteobacteria bacterium CG22_combo_CG10-13_8_21_14_all_40_8]